MLYVKMLPYDKAQGRKTKTYTILNPDTGGDTTFHSGDPEWGMVSDLFGAALRKAVAHIDRINSPQLFLVCTKEEADQRDREDAVRRSHKGRRVRPRRSLARDLTQKDDGRSVADRMSGPAEEQDHELSEVEALQSEMDEQSAEMDALKAMVAKMADMLPGVKRPKSDAVSLDVITKAPEPDDRAKALDMGSEEEEAFVLPGDDASPVIDTEAEDDARKARGELPVTDVKGVGEKAANELVAAGVENVAALAGANVEYLKGRCELTVRQIRNLKVNAEELLVG